MRLVLALTLIASPAAAWDFSATPICTLTHSADGIVTTVTYDAAIPEYTISLVRPDPWPNAPTFGLAFAGPRGLTIGTDRHVLSDGGSTLTVTDSGFGNVLDGLQFNDTMTALIGDDSVTISLDGASEPGAAFRACPAPATS